MTPPIRPGPAAAATPPSCRVADAGLLHGRVDDAVEQVDMGARGDLRHHAAERRVILDLRVDDVRQDAAGTVLAPLDHGGGGLVAGGLDAQHQHLKKIPSSP